MAPTLSKSVERKPKLYSPGLPRRADSFTADYLKRMKKISDDDDPSKRLLLANSTFYAALDLSASPAKLPEAEKPAFAGRLSSSMRKLSSGNTLSAAERKLLRLSSGGSPAVTPSNSPKDSPPLHRHSPLTLSNDRTPRYV